MNICDWDCLIITASNHAQKLSYDLNIKELKRTHVISKDTKVFVVPDIKDERIGSGGATLNVFKVLTEYFLGFSWLQKKCLLIHSGGDSKRIPTYSVCGKLFSPFPTCDNNKSLLIEQILKSTSYICENMTSGMLVCSGDVFCEISSKVFFDSSISNVFSSKTNINIAKNHGVFEEGEENLCKNFLHKQSLEKLSTISDENNNVNIDTGIVYLCKDVLMSLLNLIIKDGKISNQQFFKFVNSKVRLNFYSDFLFPLATNANKSEFLDQAPENVFCEELIECRNIIYNNLKGQILKIVQLQSNSFIHLGTVNEVISFHNKLTNDNFSTFCSYIYNSQIEEKCYIENSIIENSSIGANSYISNCVLNKVSIPNNIVLNTLQLVNGKYVTRIFGINDNPKQFLQNDGTMFGKILKNISNSNVSLWDSKIYKPFVSQAESVKYAIEIYKQVTNYNKINISSEFLSLSESFKLADYKAMLTNIKVIKLKDFYNQVSGNIKLLDDAGFLSNFSDISNLLSGELNSLIKGFDLKARYRLPIYLSKLHTGKKRHEFELMAYSNLKNLITRDCESKHLVLPQTTLSDIEVALPARVNFAGGWTDTPPYCIEKGGSVLNASILINNEPPIMARIKKNNCDSLIFKCCDNDSIIEIVEVNQLFDFSDIAGRFNIFKASLLACGIINNKTQLCDFIKQYGGLVFETEVKYIPQNSGLGASSILACACVKAVSGFFKINYSDSEIVSKVLSVEQLLGIGGGWQDQVGGLINGIKLVTSKPSLTQKPKWQSININNEARQFLNDKFCLIYSGTKKFTANIMPTMFKKFILQDETYLKAIKNMRKISHLLAKCLGDWEKSEFIKLMNDHFIELVKLNKFSINKNINIVFKKISPYIDAKMICGAGGGGFLQVVLKDNISKHEFSEFLKSQFVGQNIYMLDFKFNF